MRDEADDELTYGSRSALFQGNRVAGPAWGTIASYPKADGSGTL